MRALPAATSLVDTYPNPNVAALQAALLALRLTIADLGESPELDLASAATCDVGGQNGSRLRITGTTGITSLGTNYRGSVALRFAGVVAITHNATSLICPNGASFVTTAGDVYMAIPKATSGTSDGWLLVPLNTAASRIGVAGQARNVKMSITAASTTATLTADEIIVETALGGNAQRLASFSQSINVGTTGAGGMDTGSVPATGFVALYAIYNPATGASALLAVNCTSAAPPTICAGTMPSGYTYSALVSIWRTASSVLVVGIQREREVSGADVNVLASGAATTLTSVGLSGFCPFGAKSWKGYGQVATATAAGDAANFCADNVGNGTGRVVLNVPVNTNAALGGCVGPMPIITEQTAYYKASASGMTINLYGNGYTF